MKRAMWMVMVMVMASVCWCATAEAQVSAAAPTGAAAAKETDPAKAAAASVAKMLRDIADSVEKAPATATAHDHHHARQRDSLLERFHIDVLLEHNSVFDWLRMLGCLFAGVVAGRFAASALRSIARRMSQHGWVIRGSLFEAAAGPANLALVTAGIAVALMQVIPHPFYVQGNEGYDVRELHQFTMKVVLFLYAAAAVWYLSNLVNVVEVALLRFSTRHQDSPLDQQLVPIVTKTLRLFVIVLGVLFVAQSVFGADIGAWLAGLGIAGLAVSLAAQDTLKNLFGSLTLLLDKPFRVGERVILKGYDGTVEEINLRAVRIRTGSGHVITLPNQIVVNDVIENPARRPFIFRQMNVTIAGDTPRAKVQEAVAIIRTICEEPGIAEPIHGSFNGSPMPPRVYFNAINADSYNIQVQYWHFPPDWWAYMDHAQRLQLRIIEAFEKASIELSLPTQRVLAAGDQKRQLAMKMLGADHAKP